MALRTNFVLCIDYRDFREYSYKCKGRCQFKRKLLGRGRHAEKNRSLNLSKYIR